MKKNHLLFIAILLFSFKTYSQNVSNKIPATAAEIERSTILINAPTIEFKDEMLIFVSELNQKNIKQDLINHFNRVKGLKYIGFCEKDRIIKVLVDKTVYNNLTDVEHKIIDTKIISHLEFRKGNFLDLDNVCK